MFGPVTFIGKSWDAATGTIMSDSEHPELVGKSVFEWSEAIQIQMSVIDNPHPYSLTPTTPTVPSPPQG